MIIGTVANIDIEGNGKDLCAFCLETFPAPYGLLVHVSYQHPDAWTLAAIDGRVQIAVGSEASKEIGIYDFDASWEGCVNFLETGRWI